MSREYVSFEAPDISALARSLKRELDGRDGKPGHVELLNILSRAAGFRNFQHLKASRAAEGRISAPAEPAAMVDHARVEAAMRCFEADGMLARWPARTSLQQLCLWMLWAAVPAETDMSEKDVNTLLKTRHRFGDHALLRREMVNRKLLFRTADCRLYRRIEQRPPPEALALFRAVARKGAAVGLA